MKAVIIAGGMGTRLRPLTYNTPKPIVPLANRPFIVHQIEHLVKHGVDEVIINLHYLSQEIKKLLNDGKHWGIKIRYSIEESPLGTAGAVKNAEEFFGRDPLVVFNGDILTDVNISKLVNFHREKGAIITLTLTEVEDPTPFGLVQIDQDRRITQFIEKPSWNMVRGRTINAGIYVVDPIIFQKVPQGRPFSFERELFPSLLAAKQPLYGFVSPAYWMDIGNPRMYMMAHQAILRGEVAVKIFGTRINGKFWLGNETHPDPSVRFIGPSVIGQKVKLDKETEIGDYVVIGDEVSIGQHCALERAIVWRNVKIGDHVRLSGCIIGANCVIEDDVIIDKGLVLADDSVIKKGTRLTA
ncbi:MAG: NDP-sugar synthase [Candidatus Saganbacteria bacterium]|nr:NDP-sugar synthase [Candidatus Saganbacteria bacterium]